MNDNFINSINIDEEIWLPVPGYEGFYSASDLGRIRSEAHIVMRGNGIKYTVRSKILACPPNHDGYPFFRAHRDDRPTLSMYVHDAVLAAHRGPKPDGLEVRHLDDVKSNCALSNLEYGTRTQNSLDAVRNGTQFPSSRTECGNGHTYTPETTRYYRNRPTVRVCVTCNQQSQRRHQQRREWAEVVVA